MSGGHFEYKQYYIDDIADSIERSLDNPSYDEEDSYTEDTIQIMKDAVNTLRKAAIYAHRIDWFLSGDDGEETLKERLADDLKKLEDQWEYQKETD